MSVTDRARAALDPRLALCGIWIAVVVVLYSRTWHPWALMVRSLPSVPADVLAASLRLLIDGRGDLAALGLGLLAALGAGRLALRLLVPDEQSFTYSLPLGLGILAHLTFLLGLLGGYTGSGAAAALAVVGLFAVVGTLGMVRMARLAHSRERGGLIRTLFFVCWAVMAVFLLAKAMSPAVFYDAVTYHLGVPNYYLQEGGIGYIPFDAMSNVPFLTEMLYTLGMFLHGLRAAQMTSVLLFLLTALVVRDFCRDVVGDVDPHLPALFFLLTPAFFEVSILYTNDLALVCFLLLVLRCIQRWRERGSRSFIVLGGIFAGLAMGVKYTAILYLPVLVVLGLWPDAVAGRRAWATSVKAALLLAGVALLADAPWLLKNIVATGDPLYPFMYDLFGSNDMTPQQYANIFDLPGRRNSLANLCTHPWWMFFSTPAAVNNRYGAAFCLGPFIVLLIPPLLLTGTIPPAVKRLLLLAGGFYFLWAATLPEMRYLFPAVTFLSIPLALSAKRLVSGTPAWIGAAVGAVVAFFFLFNLAFGFRQVDKWTSAEGFDHFRESDGEHLARRARERGGAILAAFPVQDLANRTLPEDANVLLVGDAQHLYIRRKHQYSYISATTPLRAFERGASGNGEIAALLRHQGVTHIIFNPRELLRLQQNGIIAFPAEHNRTIEAFVRSPAVRLLGSTNINQWPVYLFELVEAGASLTPP